MANQENKGRVSHFPEHGPIAENGREVLLSLKNVDITFGKGEGAVKAVKDASFDIYKGETFSLVGESGSGKTTIGRAVIRVNPLANGEIQLVVNTPLDKNSFQDDSYLRKAAIKAKIPYMTTMAAAKATADGVHYVKNHEQGEVKSLQEYHSEIK